MGILFDIQRFSVHDGPGIRTTLFFKGCPLRCPWCHSPESWAFEPEHIAFPPTGELRICGVGYTVDEILGHTHRDMPFYKRTGGGVTLSGGECLYQPEFLLELLQRCKAECFHTAVDTSGHAEWGIFEAVLPYTDVFLYDIKSFDSDLHERIIGVPNDLILKNAQRLASAGARLAIRIPLIPMFNDSEEAFDEIGRFILELGKSVESVQILPYHNLGTEKWKRLQTDKPIFEAALPSKELIKVRREQLTQLGIIPSP